MSAQEQFDRYLRFGTSEQPFLAHRQSNCAYDIGRLDDVLTHHTGLKLIRAIVNPGNRHWHRYHWQNRRSIASVAAAGR